MKKDIKKKPLKKKSTYYKSKIGAGVFRKSMREKYLSSDNGIISSFFLETDITKKRNISAKINDKLIKLLIEYSNNNTYANSKSINILIHEICLQNLKHFVLKTIDTKSFDNKHFINIDLNMIYEKNEISDYVRKYFITIYYEFVTKYVGTEKNKYFKIHQDYYNLLIQNKSFFEYILLFVKDNKGSALNACNINYIIIILYTYTTLLYDVTHYFPKNYYEIIIESFINYIKNYGYPAMNKSDYYEKLKLTLTNNQIDQLNTFNNKNLSKIIVHPSFTKKPIVIPYYKKKNFNDNSYHPFSSGKSRTPSSAPGPAHSSAHSSAHSPAYSLVPDPATGYSPNIPSGISISSSTHLHNQGLDSDYFEVSTHSPVSDSATGYSPKNPSGISTSSNTHSHIQGLDSDYFEASTHSQQSGIMPPHNTPTSGTAVRRCPDNIKQIKKLLNLFGNKEYGYRWKMLHCDKYNIKKYGCNNINYDKNDLKYNSNVISMCQNTLYINNDNMIDKKIYRKYIGEIKKNTYPYNQITRIDLASGEYSKIIKYILKIKNKNPFNDVIIIDDNIQNSKFSVVLVAYDKFQLYNLYTDSTGNYNIELNYNNKIILSELENKSISSYGKIFKGKILNKDYAIKLSLCDNTNSHNYNIFKQSNLKEIHIFDILSKYAISKININLPIIYKTIQLDASEELILKLFLLKKEDYKKRIKGCNLRGKKSTVNCSIIELYNGTLRYYISELFSKNNYLEYSISGFENIIISILSFWSVTKCVHKDAHMSNFLYKIKDTKKDFNKNFFNRYNIHGKDLYTSYHTKYIWTLWDYGTCMPFIYEHYFKNESIVYFYDDIHRSVLHYCVDLLDTNIIEKYIINIYNLLKIPTTNLNHFHYSMIYFIYIYYINILINYYNDKIKHNIYYIKYIKLKETYYKNVDKFFFELLHYIINLSKIKITDVHVNLIHRLYMIEKNGSYNINPIVFNNIINNIFKPFKQKLPNEYTSNVNDLKKYFYNETLTCLMCCKFLNIYFDQKEFFKNSISNNPNIANITSNYNIANNVVCMVVDVINIFKKNTLFNEVKKVINSKNIDFFNTNIDESLVASVNYIGNNFIGKHWIKVDDTKGKIVKNLGEVVPKDVFDEFKTEFERCKKTPRDNSYIVVLDKIEEMKVFDFLNNYSKNKSYIFNYYYLTEDFKYYVTYNDIDYVLYNKIKNFDCSD